MKLAGFVGIVAGSRARTAGVFPLPDAPGCVDYAICEAAETLDAILRERRAGDKRNNVKEHDARREWGQCGYMICSGLMQTDYPLTDYRMAGIEGTIYDVLQALAIEAMSADTSLVDALAEWHGYCQWQEWDADALLRETCAEFERKHLGVAA